MNINRHNYEEYFILYMDNELSADERKAVEAFIQQHPDLKDELDLLLHYKMEPDTSVVFNGKEELMKVNGDTPITLNNYQEWLLLYIDGELPVERINDLQSLIKREPSVQLELALLQKSKLQPEPIVFAHKDSLYRKEERVRRIIPVGWMRIAAALLLAALITTAILVISRKPSGVTGKPDLANKGTAPSNIIKEELLPDNKVVNSSSNNNAVVAVDVNTPGVKKAPDQPITTNDQAITRDKKNDLAVKNDHPATNKTNEFAVRNNQQPQEKNNKQINIQSPEQKEEKALTVNDNLKPGNNLPVPANNPNLIKNDAVANNNNAQKNNSQNSLTNDKVTNPNSGSSNTGNPAVEFASNKTSDETLEEGSSNKKKQGVIQEDRPDI